jgi:hypothetical protein
MILPFCWNGAFQFIFGWLKVGHKFLYLIVLTDPLSAVILIWRLYALYNQSKLILHLLIGSFLIIVALSIVLEVYLYSRPEAFSGESQFLLGSICVQADGLLYSDRNSNSERQILHGFLQNRANVCDLYFHPDRMLRYLPGCSRRPRPRETP